MSSVTDSDRKIDVLSRTKLHEGFFSMEKVEFRHQDFNGEWTNVMTREVLHIGGVAAVQLYDPDLDSVVLLEQFRTGAYLSADERSPWLYECVAGLVEEGEPTQECAKREALEETGCTVTEIEKITTVLPSPGALQEVADLYVGKVSGAVDGSIHGHAHEGEHIRIHVVPVEDAFRMVDEGTIGHSLTIIALQWLRIHRDALRKRWLGETS